MRPSHFRAYDFAGQVIVEMALPADGPAVIQADRPVSRVVFYQGEPGSAVVVGCDVKAFPPQGEVLVDWKEPDQ